MKNIYLIFLLFSSTLYSCGEANESCTPEETLGNFTEGKQIISQYNATSKRNYYIIGNGENMVFEFKHAMAQCDNIYDDELLKVLTFEVDKNATQFRFEGNEVIVAKGFYQQFATWQGGMFDLKSGFIEGTKISESKWKVKASVLTAPRYPEDQPVKIEFEEIFSK